MRKLISLLTIVLAISIILNRQGLFREDRGIKTFNISDIKYIEIYNTTNENINTINRYVDIEYIINSIAENDNMLFDDINSDTPIVYKYITLHIINYESEKDIIYIYEDCGRYFVEKPYGGIYEIPRFEYENILEYTHL